MSAEKNFTSNDTLAVTDSRARDLLFKIIRFLKADTLGLFEFDFMEYQFDKAVTNFPLAHGKGYVPLDIIETSKTGSGVITFHYDNFTDRYILVSVTGPCKVRFLYGKYRST